MSDETVYLRGEVLTCRDDGKVYNGDVIARCEKRIGELEAELLLSTLERDQLRERLSGFESEIDRIAARFRIAQRGAEEFAKRFPFRLVEEKA